MNDNQPSLPVGSFLGEVNKNGNVESRYVKDVNQLYSFSGFNITSANVVYSDFRPIGFVYEDNAGAFWFQKDPSTNWNLSFAGGVSLGKLFNLSFGATAPNDEAAVSIGSSPGKLGDHEVAKRCWSQGAQFWNGQLSA